MADSKPDRAARSRRQADPHPGRAASVRRRLPARRARTATVLLAVTVLVALYAATLQTHISGTFDERSPALILQNEYIKDVAEIQVALNVWGTIHHTGYPLFAILGNLFTAPLRWLGVEGAAAASLYAAAWGALFLLAAGALLWRLTGDALLAALSVLLLGVTRSIWLHHVVAEVYSMSMAITALLLVLALWPGPWSGRWGERRFLGLALLGGIGVAHHRALALLAPGLLLALWPHRQPLVRRWRWLLPRAAALVLVGFVPYVYLPLRAAQDAAWVYGEPGTPRGLWIEFSGREADRLVKLPRDLAELWRNARGVWGILVRELTLPGVLVALLAVAVALRTARHGRTAAVLALSALGPALFALFFHTAVLPQAVLMPVVMVVVISVALAADVIFPAASRARLAALAPIAVWAGTLAAWNVGYIGTLTAERTGVATIERLAAVPRDPRPALMLPWGPRHAAAAYAALVTGEHADVHVVDHKADFRALLDEGYALYTFPETFYNFTPPWPTPYGPPADWWSERIGSLYLTSAAPGVVRLLNTPWLASFDEPLGTPLVGGILLRDAWLTCNDAALVLHVRWTADEQPALDPSIFVHVAEHSSAPAAASADQRHPVYGLYPFNRLAPGEIVQDDVALPRPPGDAEVRFGLYDVGPDGAFVNYSETILRAADCQSAGQVRP